LIHGSGPPSLPDNEATVTTFDCCRLPAVAALWSSVTTALKLDIVYTNMNQWRAALVDATEQIAFRVSRCADRFWCISINSSIN
jgi:hypothetical protein